ncbi:MAG: hypothetical protein ALECFALPRED_001595 [Alectoria fallacina]|uniref:Cyanovirin-N domain-containing protein n=1 Tax=Alectoria fallacina TaxID=1903189 RepID=A0A8H3F9L9_9LECA|nr:MAG: hypothetical protein ALECFALPRED_001595 [Alectoria fallacina]
MHPYPALLLSLATLLPLTLSAPSPRKGGGGISGGGISSGSDSSAGLALASLGGVIVANAQNGYSLDSDAIPNAGYDASSTCTYAGANATNEAAAAPAWISSMTGCLDALNAEDWNGNECAPPVGGMTFGFWKGENDYSDGVDCYNRCAGCLGTAINASQAVTTKCQYEYKTHELVGYKTHTCTMGYDAGT